MSNERNPYCWVCNKNNSEMYCSKCAIGFHFDCIEQNFEDICDQDSYLDDIFLIKQCFECQKIKESRRPFSQTEKDRVRFKKPSESLLNSILKKIFTKGVGIQPITEIMKTWLEDKQFEKNVSPLIDTINSKLQINAYTCPEEFLFDVKRIRHAIRSLHPEINIREINLYVENIENNCQEVSLCPYCVYNYLGKPNGAAEICPWGHKLVLVNLSQGIHFKLKNVNKNRLENLPPVFPAKVLRFQWSSRLVTVRTFFSLLSIQVSNTDVYDLRSSDLAQLRLSINIIKSEKERKEFDTALRMANLHVAKLKSVYGKSSNFLTDRKRVWYVKRGYFISREVDKSKFNTTVRSSGEYTSRSNLLQPDGTERQDQEINTSLFDPDRYVSSMEKYLEDFDYNVMSEERRVQAKDIIPKRMKNVPAAAITTEIVPCRTDSADTESSDSIEKVTFCPADDRMEIEESFLESNHQENEAEKSKEESRAIKVMDSHGQIVERVEGSGRIEDFYGNDEIERNHDISPEIPDKESEMKPNVSELIVLLNQNATPIVIDLTQDDDEVIIETPSQKIDNQKIDKTNWTTIDLSGVEQGERNQTLPTTAAPRQSVIVNALDLLKNTDCSSVVDRENSYQIDKESCGHGSDQGNTLSDFQEEVLDLSMKKPKISRSLRVLETQMKTDVNKY